jgi:hypothetical protein
LGTVEDHLFYGMSVWLVTRRYAAAAADLAGRPAEMVRIPWHAWSTDDAGRVTDLDGQPIDPNLLIVIPGPHEGILNFAQRTIRGAIDLERTAADVARRPFRLLLNQTTDITLDAADRAAIVGEARRALRDNDGVLFTNAAIEATTVPIDSGALLIDGRNASALDVARHVSMPAAMLDATSQGASWNTRPPRAGTSSGSTTDCPCTWTPIAARLSMDDVVPQGQRVAFDAEDLTSPVASADRTTDGGLSYAPGTDRRSRPSPPPGTTGPCPVSPCPTVWAGRRPGRSPSTPAPSPSRRTSVG